MQHFLRLLLLLIATTTYAQGPIIKPIPAWVSEVEYQETIKNEEAESGYFYLLYDKQLHIPKKTKYSHSVVKIINSEGITQMSDLTFEFDPNYEKLIFHKIDVVRDGERLSKLDLSKIETIQRESNLEKNLYDGRLTSLVNLSDIREGDVLDYAYSIVGVNPVYKGGYSNVLYFEYQAPIGALHFSVAVPNNNTFKFKYYNEAPQPTLKDKGGIKEYEWNVKNIKARYYDINTPVWYDDFQYVQFGNYDSWESIVNQYKELYSLNNRDKKALKHLSEQQIKTKNKELLLSKKEIADALINFVQDDVRYFGFENGMNSHLPESPLKVLEQRYGDCKGKSYLLSELLQARGIEAYPMLVHSSNGQILDDKLPTPNLFNHCVVTYEIDGEQLYIDPTISNQGSSDQGVFFPDYKKGLVLKSGEKGLTDIVFKKQNGISISEFYDIEEIRGGGELSVVTTYKGSDADMVRADFEKRSNASIQKEYLRFYSTLYPDIKKIGDLEVEDLRNTRNEFIVRESYRIDSIWTISPDNENFIYFEAYPLALESYVNPSASPVRTAPYKINNPLNVSFDISVQMPEEWEFEDYESKVDSDYFSYEQRASYYGNKLLVTHNYERKKDFVAAKDVRKYIADHKKIQDDLSYFVTYDLEAATAIENSGLSWISILLVILTIGFGGYWAYRLYYDYDVPARVKDKKGKNIGGWLILIAIGLIFTPIVILSGLILDESYYDAYSWSALWNTPGPTGKPMVFLIAVEMIVNYAFVIYSTVIIILFFQRRTIVPRLMIILYGAILAFLILDTVVALALAPDLFTPQENQESFKEIIKGIFRCAIWIPYFLVSQRVKETFVRRSPNYKEPVVIPSPEELVSKKYDSLESRFERTDGKK